jgi:uncharacterized protein YeaO (DUF488 family)
MTRRKAHRVRIKRAYEDPSGDDGRRVLVDRMWPRGIARERLAPGHGLANLQRR